MTFLQELLHLGACRVEAWQHGEDRLLAFQRLLVEHIVGLVELRQSWCAVDHGDGVDIFEFMFAVV